MSQQMQASGIALINEQFCPCPRSSVDMSAHVAELADREKIILKSSGIAPASRLAQRLIWPCCLLSGPGAAHMGARAQR